MNRQKLENWLKRAFYESRDEGPCTKLVLRHITVGGKATKDGEVCQIRVPHNDDVVTVEESELDYLLNDIESAAYDDACGLGGLQKYKLLAFFGNEGRPSMRFTFRASGSEYDEDEEDELSEPATKKGLVSQLMRHNEALMRTAVMGANQTISMLTRVNAQQGNQLEKMMQERRQNFELVEDLKSQKHERELDAMSAENREKRLDKALEKGLLLAPAVVNRLTGKEVLPEKETPLMALVKGFKDSLTPEQVQSIAAGLKPEQQVALMEIMRSASENEEK